MSAQAHHWETEVLTRRPAIGDTQQASVHTVIEVPIAVDGSRLPSRGNRYWPTTIDLVWDMLGPGSAMLTADDARAMAEALSAAADECDALDGQDSDPCGHWHPCRCGRKQVAP